MHIAFFIIMAKTSPKAFSASVEVSQRHDELHRALYIRRECAVITACRTAPPGEAGASRVPDDVLLLPPHYSSSAAISRVMRATCRGGGGGERDGSPSSFEVEGLGLEESPSSGCAARCTDAGWSGLIAVTDAASPWRGGWFPFTVFLPDRYPFECPVIEMCGRWSSHPFIVPLEINSPPGQQQGEELPSSRRGSSVGGPSRYGIPFEHADLSSNPLRVSVLARAMQHIHAVFSPSCWTPAFLQMVGSTFQSSAEALRGIDRARVQRDVERCSVTQEVLLGKPYVDYLHTSVTKYFVDYASQHGAAVPAAQREGEGEEGARHRDWVTWYGREFLPHVLKMP